MRLLSLSIPFVLAACSSTSPDQETDQPPEPTIEITSPAHRSLVENDAVEVIVVASGLEAITVNGEQTSSNGDSYTATIPMEPGVQTVVAEGVDTNGDTHFVHSTVVAGEFADGSDVVEDSLWLRLNQGGLDHIMDVVSEMVLAEDIEAAIIKAGPVYEDRYEFLGFEVYEYQANVTRLEFDTLALEANPRSGVIGINAVIPDLEVDVLVEGEVSYIDFDTETWFWADQAIIQGDIYLDVTDGDLIVDLSDTNINLVGFGYDLGALPGDVVEGLFADSIEETIEETLLEQIGAMLPEMIDETLTSLDLSFETELMGAEVSAAALYSSIEVDEDGVEMAFDIAADVSGQQLLNPDIYLTSSPSTPSLDNSADASAAVSDDLLNAVLFKAWNAQMISLQLSTDDGSLEGIMLLPLHATEGSVDVDAGLPPVVIGDSNGMLAQAGALAVSINTPDGELGSQLELEVDIQIEISLGLSLEKIVIELGTPTVGIQVIDSDWGASNEATTNLISEMIPIELFMLLIPDIEIEVPSLGKNAKLLPVDTIEVGRDPAGAHTLMKINLAQ